MKNVDLLQKFIKVARVVIIILMTLCLAMTLFCLAGLVLWIVCGTSYIWSLHYVVAFIISLFNGGSYYGSIALAATSVIAYAVRATLFYYGLRCCTGAIREKTPFNRHTCREVFWLGVKVIIFPVAAMVINVGIFSYMGLAYRGAYIGGLLSLVMGVLLMGGSLVLYLGTRKMATLQPDAGDDEYELEDQDLQNPTE